MDTFYIPGSSEIRPNPSARKYRPAGYGRVLLDLFNNAFYAAQQRQLTAGSEYKPVAEVGFLMKDQQVQLMIKDNGH